ncbi:MAG TPA: hypothetical protein VMT24_17200, partial [Aggregatilineaceae bacterium]|nr:hypothetical protein [Aggregatilineaceae bacterium]
MQRTDFEALLKRVSLQSLLFQLRAFIAFILLFLYFWYRLPDVWVKGDTVIILAKHVAQNALLGIGMTY